MQCEKFEHLWNEALDERRRPDDDVQLVAHAQHCAACSGLLAGGDALWDGLDARQLPSEPDDLPERVMSALKRDGSFARPALIAGVVALAAALLLAIGVRFWQATPQPNSPDENVANLPAPAPHKLTQAEKDAMNGFLPDETNSVPLPPVFEVLTDAEIEYLAMMRQTGTVVALFPDKVRRVTRSEEGGMFADRIRPVAQPVTAALNALKRTLPGMSADSMAGMPDDTKS